MDGMETVKNYTIKDLSGKMGKFCVRFAHSIKQPRCMAEHIGIQKDIENFEVEQSNWREIMSSSINS